MRWHWACLAVAVLAAVVTAVLSAIPPAMAGETEKSTVAVTTEVTTDENGEPVTEVTIDGSEQEEKTYTITLLHSQEPEYPEDARKDGAGGRVLLKLTINPDGTVGEVESVEEVEAYPSLTEAAVEAASEWIFAVHSETEGETTLEVLVPIEFKMDGERTKTLKIKIPDATEQPDGAEQPEQPDAPEEPDVPEEE